MAKAVKAGDDRAVRELYETRGGNWISLQAEMKAAVLARAKTSDNRDLLLAAASIYGNDRLGVVNMAQQMEYLMRAWRAGDAQSAGAMAQIYVRVKDYENAYRWSLLCNFGCSRQYGETDGDHIGQTALRELESHLSPAQIARLQEEASLAAAQASAAQQPEKP